MWVEVLFTGFTEAISFGVTQHTNKGIRLLPKWLKVGRNDGPYSTNRPDMKDGRYTFMWSISDCVSKLGWGVHPPAFSFPKKKDQEQLVGRFDQIN